MRRSFGCAEGGADAQAGGLDAVAVEVEARQVLAEGLGQAVVAVRPARACVRVEHLALPWKPTTWFELAKTTRRTPWRRAPSYRWKAPRMLASRMSSKGRSTEMPPMCTMASQPATRRSTASLSARSQGTTSSPSCALPMASMSDTRRMRACGLSRWRSTVPRAPAAPVSRSRCAGGRFGVDVMRRLEKWRATALPASRWMPVAGRPRRRAGRPPPGSTVGQYVRPCAYGNSVSAAG
jgi:hypothetical protein